MKFFHLSDLHLGKRVHEWSMLEDQEYILNEILALADREKPDAVVIAGDIYDKPVPPAEAVTLLDRFLSQLAGRDIPTLVISGNHDSPERLAFGGRLLAESGVYLAPVYAGEVTPVTLTDAFGPVNFWLLPFLKPAQVRRWFPEREIAGYTDAVGAAVEAMEIDPAQRNVLVTHQFVTGSERTESEELSVGGADNVDAAVFDGFDYVALGHLHRPQQCGSERIRYCGTPLKYSFSEEGDEKSVTVVELGEKRELTVRTEALRPLRELVTRRGTYDQLTLRENYAGTSLQEDYVRVVLTDEEDVPDAAAKLRTVYHRLMKLEYDNARTRYSGEIAGDESVESKSPLEVFADLYQAQNNRPMTPEQEAFLRELAERAWGEEARP